MAPPNGRHAAPTDTDQSTAASLDRLAAIVRTATDAIVVVDERLQIVRFNTAAERLFGLPAHQAINRCLDRILTADDGGGLTALKANGDAFPCHVSIATHEIDGRREFTLIVQCAYEREPHDHTRRNRAESQTFLYALSSTFIGLPDETVDEHMVHGFARVGAFLKMDRITLIELSPDRDEMVVAYSWSSPGVPAPAPRIDRQSQPWFLDQIRRGAVSLAPELDDLPDEAAAEKEYLRQRGVVSAASIPLKIGGEIAGAMTFITVNRPESWSPVTVNRLRAIGDILWNALKRRQAMQARIAAE